LEHVVVAGLNGLVVGASIALVADGLALLFGVLGILNFAQGDFFMAGAYIVWIGVQHGLSFWLAVVAAVVVVGVVGGLGLMGVLWPLRQRPQALVLLATIALSLIVEQLAAGQFGADAKFVAAPVAARVPIGTGVYPAYDLVVVVAAAAVLVGGFVFLRYMKYGIWLRAVAQNQRMASALGLPVPRVYAVAFVVSAAMAAVAGSMLVPLTSVYPTVGLEINLRAFIVVIAGVGQLSGCRFDRAGVGGN
jgi:branched-chain amino acid transport system permease protein